MIIRIAFFVFISVTISYAQIHNSVKYLTKSLINIEDNDSIKTAKIINWITANIEFNTNGFKTQKVLANSEIIKNKAAINQEYSNLFASMLTVARIKNVQILGYYKDIFHEPGAKFLRANHMWNTAFINGKWELFDITLASGYLVNKNTTNANKQKLEFVKSFNEDMIFVNTYYFRKSHFPLQKYWQLHKIPLSLTNFENDNYPIHKNVNYNFNSEIEKHYKKRPKTPDKVKEINIATTENPNNIAIIGIKYCLQSANLYNEIIRGSVSDEVDYKKTITKINKLNKASSMQFSSHIRNVKAENRLNLSQNKTRNTKTTWEIKGTKKTISNYNTSQTNIINKLTKIKITLNKTHETYEKNKKNNEFKTQATKQEIKKHSKILKSFIELEKINDSIAAINKLLIHSKISSLSLYIDSIAQTQNKWLKQERKKTGFLNNFNWNDVSIFDKYNDTISKNKKNIEKLINTINTKIDNSYFTDIEKINSLIINAEAEYIKARTLIIAKNLSDDVFSIFINKIDLIYTNAQDIIITHIQPLEKVTANFNKTYFDKNKEILSELEEQLKTEKYRYNNYNKYYTELMNQEIDIFNAAIEKCKIRITKQFDDYKTEGLEPLNEVRFIMME